MAEMLGKIWWAWQGLNLRPLRCQHKALAGFWRKSTDSDRVSCETRPEQSGYFRLIYRRFTAVDFAFAGAR